MKQILADITPVGSNNLFVTHYWPDKQTILRSITTKITCSA